MRNRMFAGLLALALLVGLWGCAGSQAEAVPSLTLPEESAAPLGDEDYADDLDGLCAYLEDNGAVVRGETEAAFTQMSYKEIGAVGGYRYRFLVGSGTVQAEFYEFDLMNLDAKGEECLKSIREKGMFTVLGNEVEATLHPSGKYIMIYSDSGSGEGNDREREYVKQCFFGFKAG